MLKECVKFIENFEIPIISSNSSLLVEENATLLPNYLEWNPCGEEKEEIQNWTLKKSNQ